MNLSSELSQRELETLTKNSSKLKSLKRKVISNQSKSKRLAEKLNTNNKEADLKVSLISSERLMLKTLNNTETINSKNLTNLLTLLQSWEEILTGRKLINLPNWTKLLPKNLLSLWLKAPKISLKFWEDLPVMLNLKNLLKLSLLKIKLFNQLNKKLNNQSKNQSQKLKSNNHNKPNQLLFQNQLLSNQLNKFQLSNKLRKLQLLLNKLQLNKKPNKLQLLNKNQLKVKDNQETTETEVQEITEDPESTEDQDKTEVQESTENQELKGKKVKEEDTTITDKNQTTDQRIKNKKNKILTMIHHLKKNKSPETSKKKKSDNLSMMDSPLLESQSQKPKKAKRNGTKELTEEKLITITNNKIDRMYI